MVTVILAGICVNEGVNAKYIARSFISNYFTLYIVDQPARRVETFPFPSQNGNRALCEGLLNFPWPCDPYKSCTNADANKYYKVHVFILEERNKRMIFLLEKNIFFMQISFTAWLLQHGCHDNILRRFSATPARVIKLFNVVIMWVPIKIVWVDSTRCRPSFTYSKLCKNNHAETDDFTRVDTVLAVRLATLDWQSG